MKLAVAGLALSHPEAFATIACRLGAVIDSVWDEDPARAEAFAAKFGCTVVSSPAQAAARRPDGAMVTCISADHGRVALPFLEAGVPAFVDKPFAISRADLDLLCGAAERTGTPLASSSSLRYAREYVTLRENLQAGRLGTALGGTAVVCHSIAGYLKPGNTWQDEIERGGGSIINMGIHGLEPLVAALGPGIASVSCCRAKLHLVDSQSEDMAVITLQWRDGKIGTVQLVCGSSAHGYQLTLYGSSACATATAPSAAVSLVGGSAFGTADHFEDYGYTGVVKAMLEMFATRLSPIPLAETREIALALLAARESAAKGCVLSL